MPKVTGVRTGPPNPTKLFPSTRAGGVRGVCRSSVFEAITLKGEFWGQQAEIKDPDVVLISPVALRLAQGK